jgi:hypothetical protein
MEKESPLMAKLFVVRKPGNGVMGTGPLHYAKDAWSNNVTLCGAEVPKDRLGSPRWHCVLDPNGYNTPDCRKCLAAAQREEP